MKEIKLTQGQVALVDDEDFEQLSKHKWYATEHRNTFYAVRHPKGNKNGRIRMHREILSLSKEKLIVDHINRNGLDNRKCNIRICTSSQNSMNQISRRGESMYKGVRKNKLTNKWVSRIRINGRQIHIGTFINEEDAAKAYDNKAKEFFGQYACLNFKEVQDDKI